MTQVTNEEKDIEDLVRYETKRVLWQDRKEGRRVWMAWRKDRSPLIILFTQDLDVKKGRQLLQMPVKSFGPVAEQDSVQTLGRSEGEQAHNRIHFILVLFLVTTK